MIRYYYNARKKPYLILACGDGNHVVYDESVLKTLKSFRENIEEWYVWDNKDLWIISEEEALMMLLSGEAVDNYESW